MKILAANVCVSIVRVKLIVRHSDLPIRKMDYRACTY